MTSNLTSIESFLQKHHLLSLATFGEELGCCSLFYAYDSEEIAFIVASDPHTEHMRNISGNPHVAGTVALETKTIGKIQGIQFSGEMVRTEFPREEKLYFKAFPYARVMNPTLWTIRIGRCKLTDNQLGFGKKLIWKREL